VYGWPTPTSVGKPDISMLISEPLTVTGAAAVLLPPVVVPPFVSFVAPVVTVTVGVPFVVGVPLTGHVIVPPGAMLAGAVGVQVPTVTPGGNPVTLQVALSADPVAVGLFRQTIEPVYVEPTVAVAGSPERSGTMSEPLAASTVVAVLFAVFGSFDAPVVPVTVDVDGVVGVPVTEHVIVAAGATVVGGTGEHVAVRPAGKPVTPQAAAVAATAGAAAFEQVNVPV
jgi:hypothetical protein